MEIALDPSQSEPEQGADAARQVPEPVEDTQRALGSLGAPKPKF